MLLLDILLLVITCICIFYCFILNRRIADLQNSRIEFARMIKELNTSIVKAEHNVNQMTELSKVTSKEIRTVVGEAREVSNELSKAEDVVAGILKQLDAKTSYAALVLGEGDESYYSKLSSGYGEKFTEDDLADVQYEETPKYDNRQEEAHKYTNQLKNFINKVSGTKKQSSDEFTLDQATYYNTLRKISAKR